VTENFINNNEYTVRNEELIDMLTAKEKQELKNIMDDKFSRGAFLGMVFNASVSHPDETVPELIKRALSVRLIAEEMVKDGN
jgi:hypothetical protein